MCVEGVGGMNDGAASSARKERSVAVRYGSGEFAGRQCWLKTDGLCSLPDHPKIAVILYYQLHEANIAIEFGTPFRFRGSVYTLSRMDSDWF